jgi:tetratricopeptide (TPR) repeat protein
MFANKTKTMNKKMIFGGLLLAFLSPAIIAQELPQPSPYAEVEQRVGLTDFEIEYSRPGVKDREIFGDLVPYGKVWRTGANASTKIELSTEAMFGGKAVEAGTYSIFTMPGESSWKFMLNSDEDASAPAYKAENNVLELELTPNEIENRESLIFYFDNIRNESADLIFEWADVQLVVPITVKADEQAVENIKNEIAAIEGNFRVYNSGARYYLDNDKDLEQALAWAEKSVEIDAKFWNVYTLSLIQNKMGKKKDAIATAKRSLELAKKDNYAPYIKMNEENIAKWSKK